MGIVWCAPDDVGVVVVDTGSVLLGTVDADEDEEDIVDKDVDDDDVAVGTPPPPP